MSAHYYVESYQKEHPVEFSKIKRSIIEENSCLYWYN